MRNLSTQDCDLVSGGSPALIAAAAAALAGGYIGYHTADFFSPVSTALGTVGTAVTLGAICTVPAPVVGTILCGAVGAGVGYFASATMVTAGVTVAGALITGAATYYGLS